MTRHTYSRIHKNHRTKEVKVGEIYKGRDGEMKVLTIYDWHNIEVLFIDTGYITVTNASNIRRGQVKDKLAPRIYGKGFIGDGDYSASSSGKYFKEYLLWQTVLRRCYSLEFSHRNFSIPSHFHNFQLFCNSLKALNGYISWKDGKQKSILCELRETHNCVL